jgi:hypothetical protein
MTFDAKKVISEFPMIIDNDGFEFADLPLGRHRAPLFLYRAPLQLYSTSFMTFSARVCAANSNTPKK